MWDDSWQTIKKTNWDGNKEMQKRELERYYNDTLTSLTQPCQKRNSEDEFPNSSLTKIENNKAIEP